MYIRVRIRVYSRVRSRVFGLGIGFWGRMSSAALTFRMRFASESCASGGRFTAALLTCPGLRSGCRVR